MFFFLKKSLYVFQGMTMCILFHLSLLVLTVKHLRWNKPARAPFVSFTAVATLRKACRVSHACCSSLRTCTQERKHCEGRHFPAENSVRRDDSNLL